jgi:uncharacterized membrane protein HdeD (DUF308 family)
MLKKLNTFINSSIIISIIMIILGIIMIVFPKASLNIFAIIIAIMLIVNGIYLIILDIKMHEHLIIFDTILPGIISLLSGILMLIYPNTLTIIIPMVLGSWFILSSILKLRLTLSLRSFDGTSWLLALIMTILSIVCGSILILNPTISSITITLFAGLIIVIYSISDIIDMIIFKRNINNIIKYVNKSIKIIDE